MNAHLVAGLLGSSLLLFGQATRNAQSKEALFAMGNLSMFIYAVMGFLRGGSSFFLILELFIAISTLCMLLKISDTYDTRILAVTGIALAIWSFLLFEGASTVLFAVGLVILGLGFASQPGTHKREWAFLIGSLIIAVFSWLVRDWIFTGLNVLFAAFSAVNLWRVGKR